MNKLEYYMYNFNVKELKKFLGADLTELLVEWFPEGEQIYSEENLINMILSVYGNKILDNQMFRRRLFKAFEPSVVLDYRVLLKGYEDEENLSVIIEAISNVPWRKNDVSLRLLRYLEISEEYFEEKGDSRNATEKVLPYDRFYELLDYQFYIKQRILAYINSENDETKMIVRMPTGTGKTKTAMHTIINQFIFNLKKDGLIIWIAHTKELLDQAYDTFCNVWKHIGVEEVTTHKIWDKFEVLPDDIKRGFVFCGVQKLISIESKNDELFKVLTEGSRIIVVDEAHRAGAARTKTMLKHLVEYNGKKKALIGLTATPGRTDDVDNELFRSMFDNKIIDIDTNLLNQ